MGSRGTRLAGLLVAGVGAIGMMVGVASGAAQADTIPLTRVSPVYPDAGQCAASHDGYRNTDGVLAVGPCSYYPAPDPATHVPAAGYVFRYAINEGDWCGIGCHTPPPAPPFYGPVFPGCPSRLSCDPH